ncbi:MAG: hypothetical protein Q9216_005648 [Gyalolechia sp. 2 TL-2023]
MENHNLYWQMVKDFLRVILKRVGLPGFGKNTKPGMVHIFPDHVAAPAGGGNSHSPRRRRVVAYINLKTDEAAYRAWREIAGHRLWGHTLAAALFNPTGEPTPILTSDTPVNGEEAVDFDKDEKHPITLPNGNWTWGPNPAGKITKMGTKDGESKKRQASVELPSCRKRARMTSTGRRISITRPLANLQDRANVGPPLSESPLSENAVGDYYGYYPVWGGLHDYYWQYPARWYLDYNGYWFLWPQYTWIPSWGTAQVAELGGDSTQEAPTDGVKGPVIVDGSIRE